MIREHQPTKLNLTQHWSQYNQEQCNHIHSANTATTNNNATKDRTTFSQSSIVNEFEAHYAKTRKDQEQQQLRQGKARGRGKNNTYHQEQLAKREQTIRELTEINTYHQQIAKQQQVAKESTEIIKPKQPLANNPETTGNSYSPTTEANNQSKDQLTVMFNRDTTTTRDDSTDEQTHAQPQELRTLREAFAAAPNHNEIQRARERLKASMQSTNLPPTGEDECRYCLKTLQDKEEVSMQTHLSYFVLHSNARRRIHHVSRRLLRTYIALLLMATTSRLQRRHYADKQMEFHFSKDTKCRIQFNTTLH